MQETVKITKAGKKIISVAKRQDSLDDSCHACGEVIEDGKDLYIINLISCNNNGSSVGNPTRFCKKCFVALKTLINKTD